MAKNVHVVPHMHWDREWYFTTEESRILLVNNMEEIMEMLETRDDYPYYVLDGQTAILEDYFAVKPENRERVKKLAEAGKLIIGPWYTQTDEMVVGGESIVRNLLYGLKDSKEFGEPMMIGYLPDSFGQSEKLPQILNGFDIDRCMFWRGSSERHGTDKHNFYWECESEGKVLVQLLPLGYAIGKYLPEEKEALEKRMSKYMPVLEKGAVTEEILLPNGHDQMPVQQNIYEVMEQLKNIYPDKDFFLSKYEHTFEKVEEQAAEGSIQLDTIRGELLDGKYMRVHRSIFSTRADLKSANTRIENKITNILEPLATIAYSLGASYEEGLIEGIWKDLMKNHAHDSIGCCCSDKVHRAIENRFFDAEDKTDELIRYYQRKIVDAMPMDITLDKFTAFNLLPFERTSVIEGEIITKMKNFELVDETGNSVSFEVIKTEVVDAGLIDRQIVHYGNYDPFVKYTFTLEDTLPAMGYKTYMIKETAGEVSVSISHDNLIFTENEFYNIQVEQNGTFTIYDKISKKTYEKVLIIQDGSDDGDEYDFSPLADDFLVCSHDIIADRTLHQYKHKAVIEIAFTMNIPKDLDSRKEKKIDASMDIKILATVKKNSPIIELSVTIDNRAKDHRVRIMIPNGMGTSFSLSDNQFGEIKRPVYDTAMDVWEKEGWDERPDSIYPMLSYVGLDNEDGLSVLTNSVREFELIGLDHDILAITLFRSVGFLGKEEMLRRPGRPSGIKLATPDSQLLGTHTYEIAIVRNSEYLSAHAKEYITPIVSYNKMPFNAMKLNTPSFKAPYGYSLFKFSDKHVVLSACKKAQGCDDLIVRAYQTVVDTQNVSVDSTYYKATTKLNLNEVKVEKLAKENELQFARNVATTYRLEK
ncbi:MAG: mannosylglycerate hydrolase [Lachnospiraceae bacterium]